MSAGVPPLTGRSPERPAALVAVDLDDTLIYSPRAIARTGGPAAELVRVEPDRPAGASRASAELRRRLDDFADLGGAAIVVPVTSRTAEQALRVRPLGSEPFRLIACAHGGELLEGGRAVAAWRRGTERLIAGALRHRGAAEALLERRLQRPAGLRDGDGLFWFGRVDEVGVLDDRAGAELASLGWKVVVERHRLHVVPRRLDKAVAVERLRRHLGVGTVIAIGDSALDAPMLAIADLAIAPRHGADAATRAASAVTLAPGPTAGPAALATAHAWLTLRIGL